MKALHEQNKASLIVQQKLQQTATTLPELQLNPHLLRGTILGQTQQQLLVRMLRQRRELLYRLLLSFCPSYGSTSPKVGPALG